MASGRRKGQPLPHSTTTALPKREEIDPCYQWRLEDIFSSVEEWEKVFASVEKLIEDVGSFRGKLGESAETLCRCLQTHDRLGERFDSLHVYAHLLRDQETTNPVSQALADRVTHLGVRLRGAASYLSPEIQSLPGGTIDRFLEEFEGLRRYRQFLDNLLRVRDHTLSPSEEKLLAMAANIASGPRNVFNMLNNADLKFPKIKDEHGNDVEVTKGRYSQLMECPDRRVRKDAFHALLGTYENYANTLAATLSANVNRDIFYSRARGYESCLAASLDRFNIPAEVYDTVLQVVSDSLSPLHRYMSIRKRVLGLSELMPYDLFVPLFSEVDATLTYEEAVQTVIDGLVPLGSEYVGLLREGFNSGWIDVFENHSKRSGAYSWGAYGTHPYVLLNYQGRLDDVFTIAHELGHSLHTYLTCLTQPYVYSDYSIFTAEVASTTNEEVLMDYFLKKTKDKKKKLHLLNHYLDQIRSTVYTQVLFAEFEKIIHDRVERGEPLTADSMGILFRELYGKYHGPAVEDEPTIGIYWARIPHFYNSFYVYQYATGYAAATTLSQEILNEEDGALEQYMLFLKAGSSRYTVDLLRDAGVDITSPEPIEATVRLFVRLLDEMEGLL